jgi:mono/diheme cytochrome c family protein
MMKVLIPRMKMVLVVSGLVFGAALLFASVPARTANEDDSAALYKAKCVACHGATAEKRFDATRPEDEMVQAVLKGKKGEKPPNMPSYEEKGITTDQAKALVTHMKQLKSTP